MIVEIARDTREVLVVQKVLDAFEKGLLSQFYERAYRFGNRASREAHGKERKDHPDCNVDDRAVEHVAPLIQKDILV
jgi:hypothetical protein